VFDELGIDEGALVEGVSTMVLRSLGHLDCQSHGAEFMGYQCVHCIRLRCCRPEAQGMLL